MVEAEPLNFHDAVEESDTEMDVPICAHQNLIKMTKEFGVIFNGCKKGALVLFMKIDCKRHITIKELTEQIGVHIKTRGVQELRGWPLI